MRRQFLQEKALFGLFGILCKIIAQFKKEGLSGRNMTNPTNGGYIFLKSERNPLVCLIWREPKRRQQALNHSHSICIEEKLLPHNPSFDTFAQLQEGFNSFLLYWAGDELFPVSHLKKCDDDSPFFLFTKNQPDRIRAPFSRFFFMHSNWVIYSD